MNDAQEPTTESGGWELTRALLATQEQAMSLASSALSNEPDERKVEAWLREVRRSCWR